MTGARPRQPVPYVALISTVRPSGVMASHPLLEALCKLMSNRATAATSPSEPTR